MWIRQRALIMTRRTAINRRARKKQAVRPYLAWDGKPTTYWQHRSPLHCPAQHKMEWLGLEYWLCGPCRVIYVEYSR